MKNACLRARLSVTALLVLLLVSMSSHAQDTADRFLSELHNFRVSNYMALDAYYRFSATGDTSTLNEIVKGINSANDSMESVVGSRSGALSNEEITDLKVEFESFKNLMRDNIDDVRNRGYPDLRLVSDMANQALTMNEKASELYLDALAGSETEANPRIEAARSAAVKMAQMMAKYSVRTNSSVTQTFQGASTGTSLDEQARELDILLATVIKGESSPELNSVLDDISSKWQFIRGSYINYNENNVGFVIDRYSKGIIDGLARTLEILQRTD